ncbi:MAG: hypothetical protein OJF49_002055 [Ktedonobacterales bacterium]|jgi:WD40 repeat protein|nr:MAG: hypothetical protein OJF49_002055 [Ktedonobacterales bacterium]
MDGSGPPPAISPDPPEDSADLEVTSLRPAPPSHTARWLPWSASSLTGKRLTRRQRAARLSSALAAVLLTLLAIHISLSGGLSLPALFPTFPHADNALAAAPAETLAQRDGFLCLRDSTWAPDSLRVAFLGHPQECDPDHFVPTFVAINDARTGKLLNTIHPDDLIFNAVRSYAPGALDATTNGVYRPAVISYHSILWSPDGTHLAITFLVLPSWNPAIHLLDGVLLITSDGLDPRVMLHQESTGNPAALYLVWALNPQIAITANQTAIPGPDLINTPPALTYAWRGCCTLSPGASLPPSDTPRVETTPDPIGSPDGGSSFSIWQPGYLELDWLTGNSRVQIPGNYTWHTSFSVWSPDGAVLATALTTAARIVPLGFLPDVGSSLVNGALRLLPLLPVRDAALEHVLEGLLDSSRPTPADTVWLSWRADGKVLALPDSAGVALYDCVTGKQLTILRSPGISATLSGFVASARWSPDGSRLLLPNGAILTIGHISV